MGVPGTFEPGITYNIYAYFDNGNALLNVNGVEETKTLVINTLNDLPDKPVQIGGSGSLREFLHGYISYVVIWDKKVSEQAQTRVIADKPILFLDPTMYNGSVYINMLGENAIPYNVIRLPDEQTWLWLVKSLANDIL